MRIPVRSGLLFAVTLTVAAACGGSTTPTTAPVVSLPPVNIPSVNVPTLPPITIPSVNVPSLPPISIPSGLSSFEIPSFAIPSFAIPSFNANADPDLAAKFPTTIAGSPVTNVQTFRFIDLLIGFGQQAQAQQFQQTMQAAGVDANSITFGTADITVNSSSANLEAIRAAGVPGNQFLSIIPALGQALNPEDQSPTVAQTSIGGKNVTTFTDADGNVTYFYPSGDIIWSTDASDPADVATILSALP